MEPTSPLTAPFRHAFYQRRGSSLLVHEHTPCCPCCKCQWERCMSHCWFLFACLGFLLISSLPRMATLGDFITTLMLYLFYVRTDEGDLSIGEFLSQDFQYYNFRQSALSVVFLAFIRSIILFFAFAYRYHTSTTAFNLSTGVVVASTVWVVLKIILCTNSSIYGLLIFSLIMTLVEYGVYIMLRRRRIMMPRQETESLLPRRKVNQHYHNLADQPSLSHAVAAAPSDGLAPETLADSDSCFEMFDGVKVHYKLDGPGVVRSAAPVKPPGASTTPGPHFYPAVSGTESHAVVLLHGFGGSTFSWKRCWKDLAKRVVVLAFDRPGFGLTQRPLDLDFRENPYTTEYSVKLLFTILDRIKIKTATLVGHSSGGAVAIMAAATHPDRVRGLFLVSPTVHTEGFPTMVRSLFRTRVGKEIVQQLVRTEIGEVALRRAWHEPANIPDDVMANYKSLTMVSHWHEGLLEMAKAKMAPIAHYLADVKCPVTILHGVEDKMVSISDSKQIVKELSASRTADLVALTDCGHVPHEEFPKEFCHHFWSFFTRTAQDPSGKQLPEPQYEEMDITVSDEEEGEEEEKSTS